MVEIMKNVFVGDEVDYASKVRGEAKWAIVHACKEPYHREALGYSGRACSKTHPEYLLAERGDRIMLNLVDVENPEWISPIIINTTMTFIDKRLTEGKRILIHCTKVALGLLVLAYCIWLIVVRSMERHLLKQKNSIEGSIRCIPQQEECAVSWKTIGMNTASKNVIKGDVC